MHDVVSEPIDPSLPDREDAAKLHRYMVISHDVFLNHPISKARVARFYSDEIAAGYMYCKKQARIAGRVARRVFIGWELRDEDEEAVEVQMRQRIFYHQLARITL